MKFRRPRRNWQEDGNHGVGRTSLLRRGPVSSGIRITPAKPFPTLFGPHLGRDGQVDDLPGKWGVGCRLERATATLRMKRSPRMSDWVCKPSKWKISDVVAMTRVPFFFYPSLLAQS